MKYLNPILKRIEKKPEWNKKKGKIKKFFKTTKDPAAANNGAFCGAPNRIRTCGLPLRRTKKCSPSVPSKCPQMLAITGFLTISVVRISSPKPLFYPSAIRQRLDKLIGGGRTFSHSVRQN